MLPNWLTTVSLSVLLAGITAKVGLKAADIRSKERRALAQPLARWSAVDADGGGDFFETLRTPLLCRNASMANDRSVSGGSRGSGAGGGREGSEGREGSPSPVGPLLLRPNSGCSSGRVSEEGHGWGGSSSSALATTSTLIAGGSSALLLDAPQQWRPPFSDPVPIDVESGGRQAGSALPLLSPIL